MGRLHPLGLTGGLAALLALLPSCHDGSTTPTVPIAPAVDDGSRAGPDHASCRAMARVVRPLSYLFRDTPLHPSPGAMACDGAPMMDMAPPPIAQVRAWAERADRVRDVYDELPTMPPEIASLVDRHRGIADLMVKTLRLRIALREGKLHSPGDEHTRATIDLRDALVVDDEQLVKAMFRGCQLSLPGAYATWSSQQARAFEEASRSCWSDEEPVEDDEDLLDDEP